jgi:flagellar hook-basal body complex protein FliE
MTLREIDNKIVSLYRQLDMMRIFEDEMVKQEGRKKFQGLLDNTLDQIKDYQKEKEKLLKK